MASTTSNKKSTIWSVVAVGLVAAGLLLFFIISNMNKPAPVKKVGGAGSTTGTGATKAGTPPSPGAVGNSALVSAIVAGDLPGVQAALAAKPQLAAVESTGEHAGLTPLQIAAKVSTPEVITAMVGAGAPIDAATATGETALLLAAAAGKPQNVAALAGAAGGATIDHRNGQGRTALMLAASAGGEGGADAVRALLNAGASLNVADSTGATALALAAQGGHTAAVVPLLQAGANTETADAQGVTPLMRAARSGTSETVVALLNGGANPKAADGTGMTALDHAKARSDEAGPEIAGILTQAMG